MRMTRRRSRRPDRHGITCQQMVALVTAYLDYALKPDERALFEAHLAECQDCPEHLQQIRATIVITGELRFDDIAPPAAQDLLKLYRRWRADLNA